MLSSHSRAWVKCLLTALACLAVLPTAAQAQPRVNRSLARQLGKSEDRAESLIWLSLPPQEESLLGAVVTPKEQGFVVVDRLPRNTFDVEESWKAEFPVSDIALPKAESPLVHSYLKGLEQPKKSYVAMFEADEVTQRTVVPKTPDSVQEFLKGSRPILAAAKAGKKLYLVQSAYEGGVLLRFAFKDSAPRRLESALAGFTLVAPDPETNEVELKSKKSVEFAYHFDAIELKLDNKSTVAKAELTPTPPPRMCRPSGKFSLVPGRP